MNWRIKALQKNIIAGMYGYFSKQFTIVTELTGNYWEVTMGVEVDGKVVELISIDHSSDYLSEEREQEFESDIAGHYERLKSKYILNHHNLQAA